MRKDTTHRFLGLDTASGGAPSCANAEPPRARGSESSNTDPQLPQPGIDRGGFDTVHLSGYGDWDEPSFTVAWNTFSSAKAEAQGNKRAVTTTLGVNERVISVEPHSGGRGFGYTPWVVQCEGMTFRFCDLVSSKGDGKPVVFVEIGSASLMVHGLRECVGTALRVLASFGCRVHLLKPSRVDLCVDLVGVDVEEFDRAYKEGRTIQRVKTVSEEVAGTSDARFMGKPGRVESMMFGKRGAGVALRIYDKLAESDGDEIKRQILLAERWGGELPQAATRVEFELRRGALREKFGVESVEELFQKTGTIVRYLAQEWFRIGSKKAKGHHTSDVETDRLWERVQCAFRNWATGYREARPRPSISLDWRRLVSTAIGCLEGAYARRHLVDEPEASEFLDDVEAMIRERFDPVAASKRIVKKFFDMFDDVVPAWDERWSGVMDRVGELRSAMPSGVLS